MAITIVCVALLGFLVFIQGFLVSLTRLKSKQPYGYTMDPKNRLYKVYRAHSNTIEYAPMLAILYLFVGFKNPSTWVLWVIGITTACRYLQAIALIVEPSLEKAGPLRMIGSAGTYIGGILLSIAVLLAT